MQSPQMMNTYQFRLKDFNVQEIPDWLKTAWLRKTSMPMSFYCKFKPGTDDIAFFIRDASGTEIEVPDGAVICYNGHDLFVAT